MFCPLCKSEFRDGFTECSDCHIPLVATAGQVQSAPVSLGKGDSQTKLDRILAALDEQNIPSHFKEIAHARPSISVFGIALARLSSTLEYQVWVLRTDFARAKQAVQSVT